MQDKELNIEDIVSMVSSFVKKNFLYLIIWGVLGLIVGGGLYFNTSPTYHSNIFAQSDFLPVDLISNEVASINTLLKENNHKTLTKKLSLDSLTSNSIQEIDLDKIDKDKNIFIINIISNGETNLNEKFGNGIHSYLESNEYIKKYLSDEKQQVLQKIELYESELEKLEKIQSNLLNNTSQSDYAIIMSPNSISSQIILFQTELNDQKLALEKIGVFQVIDIVNVVEKPSLKMKMISTMIVFLFLGAILIIIFRLFRNTSV